MPEHVKLKRRHIKEDKFADFVLSARMQATENWQVLVIGIVVIGLLVAGVLWYTGMQKEKSAASAEMLARGMMDYRGGNFETAIATWNQVVTDNDNAGSVEQAAFLLGSANLERRNYDDAITYFEKYTREHRDNKLHLAAAYAGIGQAQESKTLFADAAASYMKAAQVDSAGPLSAEYYYDAMRNYLTAGDKTQAEAQYQYLLTHYPDSDATDKAKFLHAQKMNG